GKARVSTSPRTDLSPQNRLREGDAAVTARRVRMLPVLLLGTAAMAAVVLIVSWAELVTGKIMIGFLQLPPIVLPLLFLLVVLNRAVARRAPDRALTAAEIAVAYLMMVLAAMITSRGAMQDLIPVLVGGYYYADA